MKQPVFVAIATAGRREVLTETLALLSRQTERPETVYISPATPADLDEAAARALGLDLVVVPSRKGSCAQRNAILDRLRDRQDGVVLFLDDDFFLAPTYVAETSRLFTNDPGIVLASGLVHADGAVGPGLSVPEAHALLAARFDGAIPPLVEPVYNGYGCNMAVRLAAVNAREVRFDEELPLYGWLEDVDFSRRLAGMGRLVRSHALQGVHLGSKRGRSPGRRLGYSQVANPWHLIRKRTMSPRRGLVQIGRNILANVWKSVSPEPWTDHRGRLRGNLVALADLARGRLKPSNVLNFETAETVPGKKSG